MNNVSYTKIHRGPEVQKRMIQGAIKIAEPVVETLGPSGKTVSIDMQTDPLVTQDGVTVARSIKLGNAVENHGAQLLKQVANRAQAQNGDGTTTATLIAKTILESILELNPESNLADVKEGMKAALLDIENQLVANSISVDIEKKEGFEILKSVAYISSNNDKMIAELITEAVEHSKGKNPIKINEGRKNYSYVENMDGMVYYNSVHHDLFMDVLGVTGEKVIKKAKMFFTDHDIVHLRDIAAPLEDCVNKYNDESTRYSLVIVCPEFSKPALEGLFSNIHRYRQQGIKLEIIAVKAPEFGIQQSYTLKEMGIYTGGRAILKSEFTNIQDSHEVDIQNLLGEGEFHVKRDQYSIVKGKYNKEKLDAHINYLDELIEEEESGFMQDKLSQRKAKLKGSISIIFVGAETKVEADETRERIDDAVNAVKGAISNGVVKGGGVALYEAQNEISKLRLEDPEHEKKSEHYKIGFNIVLKACSSPFYQIAENADINRIECSSVLLQSNFKQMINIRTNKVVDILEAKIFDPCKITVNSLKAALSVATTILTTKTCITAYVGPAEE